MHKPNGVVSAPFVLETVVHISRITQLCMWQKAV